eukprot:NODE_56_length_25944_cov_0.235287.p13 type:complete len:158 gc:universal NODE_56_length_25944_cov_0.235287:13510-13037(-)
MYHKMQLNLSDPVLKTPISALVCARIEHEIAKCSYICGPLHIQINNVPNTMQDVENYLKDNFHFTITNSFLENESSYHIYTSTKQFDIDVPVLRNVEISLEYFMFTNPSTLSCCINAILKELIKITPFEELIGIYDLLLIDQKMAFDTVVLGYLKNK